MQGRVKTPYSIINKLRRKRLDTLTDIAGTRIVVKDQDALEEVDREIPRRFDVVERVDFYKTPLAGYRAIHYIVRTDGMPVEIQLKTQRMAAISKAGHTAYKRGELDAGAMERFTALALKADRGDREAAREVDRVLDDPSRLKRALKRQPQSNREDVLCRKLARGEC